MEFHPIANLFPLLEGMAFDALVADIQEHGLRTPIMRHEGKILDGRNRWRACQVAKVEPRVIEFRGQDPLGFVVSMNLVRRHLSESQRAMVAARVANMRSGTRTDLASIDARSISQDQAADTFAVSPASVDRAAKVQRTGVPELVAAVDNGEIKVSAAAAIADLPEEDQPPVIEQVKVGKKPKQAIEQQRLAREDRRLNELQEKAKASPVPKRSPWRLELADCLKGMRKEPAGCARLVFADPPYNEGIDYGDGGKADDMDECKYLDWCESWREKPNVC